MPMLKGLIYGRSNGLQGRFLAPNGLIFFDNRQLAGKFALNSRAKHQGLKGMRLQGYCRVSLQDSCKKAAREQEVRSSACSSF